MSARKCKDDYEDLPLLDSFLKESARTDPLDSRECSHRMKKSIALSTNIYTFKFRSRGGLYHLTHLPMGLMSPLGTGLPYPKWP